jgi:PAS domain S-box-containing protein
MKQLLNQTNSLAQRELTLLRILLAVSSIIYLSWGLVQSRVFENLYDPFAVRIIVTAITLLTFLLTYKIKMYRIKMDYLILIPAVPMMLHSWILVFKNNWHYFYLFGLITIIWTVVGLLRSRSSGLILAFGNTIIFVIASYLDQPEIHWAAISLIAISVFATGFFGSLSRHEILNAFIDEESKSRDILNNLQEGVIVFDATGKILRVNPAAPKIMGLSESQMLGKESHDPQWKTFYEDGRPFPPEDFPVSVSLKTKKPVHAAMINIKKPDNKITTISTSSTPVFYTNTEKIKYIIVTFRDVTEVRNAQKKIEEHQLQLANNSKFTAIGEMAAGISHEINNPITVISARTTQIRDLAEKNNLKPENTLPLIERIEATLMRITRITTSMRSLFRNGAADPLIPTRFYEIIEEALDLTTVSLRNAQIKVYNNVDPNIEVMARPSELGQLIINMLSNAKDALASVNDKWIRIESLEFPNHYEFRFIDSGLGIPKEIRDKILQPFFTTKAPGQGTGLGLSISKSLMNGHGGDLWLDQNHPQTCFVVTLPRD